MKIALLLGIFVGTLAETQELDSVGQKNSTSRFPADCAGCEHLEEAVTIECTSIGRDWYNGRARDSRPSILVPAAFGGLKLSTKNVAIASRTQQNPVVFEFTIAKFWCGTSVGRHEQCA